MDTKVIIAVGLAVGAFLLLRRANPSTTAGGDGSVQDHSLRDGDGAYFEGDDLLVTVEDGTLHLSPGVKSGADADIIAKARAAGYSDERLRQMGLLPDHDGGFLDAFNPLSYF